MREHSRILSLTHKAFMLLFTKGPIRFTRYLLRGLYNHRSLLSPVMERFRAVIPTLVAAIHAAPTTISALARKGPVQYLRDKSRLNQERNYPRLCQIKAAEYAGSEIKLPLPGMRPINMSDKQAPDIARFSVLFITTAFGEHLSKRYRVDNLCEQLSKRHIKTRIFYEIEIFDRLKEALTFNIIVIQRMPMDPGIRYLLEAASARGIALVFEIDDFVFDSSVYLNQPVTRDESPEGKAFIQSFCDRLHATLTACDYFIGTTCILTDAARRLGRKSYVIRNGLNNQQVALAKKALRRPRPADGWLRIGYQPGTHTHQQDFAVAVPALIRILEEFAQVKLVIQGPLDIPETLQPYEQRIERWPFVSWQKLVDCTARLDIAIAPLEPDNLLNEAKSALKYFEPALVQVPVVASPTEDFRAAIQQGINGFLATTEEEWYESLKALVSDDALRLRMAQAARQDALLHYTPTAQSVSTLAVFQAILRDHAAPDGA